jgi:hypothetical protein
MLDLASIGCVGLLNAARPLAVDETVDVPPAFEPDLADKRPTTRQRGLTPGSSTAATIRPIVIGRCCRRLTRQRMPERREPK